MELAAGQRAGLGSVVFVGTGFSLVVQTTREAQAEMERADKLFYLVSDPAEALWLHERNASAESLAHHYAEGKPRLESYESMVAQILSHVMRGERVCVALYGHPGVGCDPTHMIMRRAETDGFRARIQPGVSSDACLYADLRIDPMEDGVQSYEASLFLYRRPRIDVRAALLLWQIGFVGEPSIKFSGRVNRPGLRALVGLLRTRYRPSHRVAIYEASWYPICPPRILWVPLRSLASAVPNAAATLYIPPQLAQARHKPRCSDARRPTVSKHGLYTSIAGNVESDERALRPLGGVRAAG